jgi:hypothetical protein
MLQKVDPAAGGGGAKDDEADVTKHRRLIQIANPTQVVAAISPRETSAYIDKLQIWLEQPLSAAEIARREQQYRVPIYDTHAEACLFDRKRKRPLRQRLQIAQPTREVVQAFAALDPYLNYSECALDLIFANKAECRHAREVFDHYSITKHSHGVHFEGRWGGVGNDTRYVGGVKWQNANVLMTYSDRDKAGPADLCLHIEWIICGGQGLHRIGINGPTDLLKLDRRAFWEQRLILADINRRRLGQRYHNHHAGRRVWRHDPTLDGEILYRAAQNKIDLANDRRCATQAVIDKYPYLRIVSHCLIDLPAEHLLPSPGSFLPSDTLL